MYAAKEKNHYEILQIKQQATLAEIETAYKKLAFKWHPDKTAVHKENPNYQSIVREHEENFKRISNAHDILKNPDLRKAYDSKLQNSTWIDLTEEQFLQALNLNKNAPYRDVQNHYMAWAKQPNRTQRERLDMQTAWHSYQDNHTVTLVEALGCKADTSPMDIHLKYHIWKKEIAKNPSLFTPAERMAVNNEFREFEQKHPLGLLVLGLSSKPSQAEFDTALDKWKKLPSDAPEKIPASAEMKTACKSMLPEIVKNIQREHFMWKPAKQADFKEKINEIRAEEGKQITNFNPK